MEYTKVGKSGLKASRLGLGTWAMGGGEAWSGETDDRKARETIDFAVAQGINLIDTAFVYGKGHSEEIVGETISRYREKVLLTTKLQRWITPDREGVRNEFEQTLKRLKTDYIDLYLIHWPMEDKLPTEVTLDAIMELKEEGKIRAIGLSNFYYNLLVRLVPKFPIDVVQLPYNLLWRFLEKDNTRSFCVQNNISIMTYSSLQQGLLTGKYKKEDRFPEGDMRAKNKLFSGERFEKCLDAVEGMREIARVHDCSIPLIAIAWVLAREGVGMSLVGAMNPRELEENLGAVNIKLSTEEMAKLDELSERAVGDFSATDVMWK